MLRNMDFNIASIILSIFVYAFFKYRYRSDTYTGRHFCKLILCIMLTSAMNIVADASVAFRGRIPEFLIYCVYSIYLILVLGCPYQLVEYTRVLTIDGDRANIFDVINKGIMYVHIFLCFLTAIFHFYIIVDDTGAIQRGNMYIAIYLASGYFLVFSVVRMFRCFSDFNDGRTRSVTAFVILSVVVAICQYFILGDNLIIYFAYSVSTLILLFAFETPDFEKLIKTKNELEISQAELRRALFDAEEASRSKTIFLSNMSHDIRTPMNAIVGYTQLAIEHLDDRKEVSECLSTIRSSGEHLLALINDVLDMSRIESGKVKLEESPNDLRRIMKELSDMTYANVEQKEQTYLSRCECENPYVYCDRLRLNQILINCIGNAIKYTGEKGTIEVSLQEEASGTLGWSDYLFSIKDNGIGMSEEFLKKVFEPFERDQESKVGQIQGTGLGMAITKNLVDMMKGQIWAESKEGIGTEFFIKLHLEIVSDDDVTDDDYDNNISVEEMQDALVGRKFLVVDDNKLNRRIVKRMLEDRGMIIDECESGQKAIDILNNCEDGSYDIVFMDIQMPGMNGYETTDIIRSSPRQYLQRVKIIAMTANAFEEDKRRAREHGMDAHVTKPFRINEFIEVLYTLLG